MASSKTYGFTGLKIVISSAAAIAIVIKLWIPDLEIDAVVLGLFVVGVLPWLAPIVKAVELPGGLKIELQEIKDAVNEAKGSAESAHRRAELAESQSLQAARNAATPDGPEWNTHVESLVEAYNRIRGEMSPGQERTGKMTEVVGNMTSASLQNVDWDAASRFPHADRGWRLMAYAFAYACPRFEYLEALTASACTFAEDNRPFGQYWSILALQKVAALAGTATIPVAIRRQLDAFYKTLQPGTDRDYEMRRLMGNLH